MTFVRSGVPEGASRRVGLGAGPLRVDEVVFAAIIREYLLAQGNPVTFVRSNDPEKLATCEYVAVGGQFDVYHGLFDPQSSSFDARREENFRFGLAGVALFTFGNYFVGIFGCPANDIQAAVDELDRSVIRGVDALSECRNGYQPEIDPDTEAHVGQLQAVVTAAQLGLVGDGDSAVREDERFNRAVAAVARILQDIARKAINTVSTVEPERQAV